MSDSEDQDDQDEDEEYDEENDEEQQPLPQPKVQHTGFMRCGCGHQSGRELWPIDRNKYHSNGSCIWECCKKSWSENECIELTFIDQADLRAARLAAMAGGGGDKSSTTPVKVKTTTGRPNMAHVPQAGDFVNRAGVLVNLGTQLTQGSPNYYCSRAFGRAEMPNGQCGPNNGPQCADCLGFTLSNPPPTFGSLGGGGNILGSGGENVRVPNPLPNPNPAPRAGANPFRPPNPDPLGGMLGGMFGRALAGGGGGMGGLGMLPNINRNRNRGLGMNRNRNHPFGDRNMVYSGGGHRLGDENAASASGEVSNEEGVFDDEVSSDDDEEIENDRDDDDDDVDLPPAPPIRVVTKADIAGLNKNHSLCPICIEEFSDQHGNLVLGCGCLVHFGDLADIIRNTSSADMRHKIKGVVKCPFITTCAYKIAYGGEYKIGADELASLIDLVYPKLSSSESQTSTAAASAVIATMPAEPMRHEEVAKYKEWLKPQTFAKKMVLTESDTLEFIMGSTKKCPNCFLAGTHWHGHACHIIHGCENCKKEYCYCCLTIQPSGRQADAVAVVEDGASEGKPKDKEKRKREAHPFCKCTDRGLNVTVCNPENILENLVQTPFPHDKRCGCAICPDCKFQAPCGLCTGFCVVCRGHVMPAPKETVTDDNWDATQEKAAIREAYKQRLLVAAQRGNTKLVKSLLNGDEIIDINLANNDGDTALILAAYANCKNVVKQLIKSLDLDVNKQNFKGYNALMAAVMAGNDEIVQILLTRTDLDFDNVNHNGETVLVVAMQHEFYALAEFLINLDKINLNIPTLSGDTALLMACRKGNVSLLSTLLSKGPEKVDCNIANKQGISPLLSVVKSGNTECLQILSDHCPSIDVTATSMLGQSALSFALDRKAVGIADILFHRYPNLNNFTERWSGDSALALCTRFGNVQLFEYVLSRMKSFVNTPNLTGETPLTISCKAGYNDIVYSLVTLADPSQVPDILNHADNEGTGLLWATRSANIDIVNFLIRQEKINLTALDPKTGNTLLMVASIVGNIEIVKSFVFAFKMDNSLSLEINKKNLNGYSVLHYAAGQAHSKERVAIADYLLKSCPTIDCNAVNKEGMTALMMAAHRGFKESVEILLQHRIATSDGSEGKYAVDVNRIDNEKRSAWSLATKAGWEGIAHKLKKRGALAFAENVASTPQRKIDEQIPTLIANILSTSEFEKPDLKVIFEKILFLLENIKKSPEDPKFRSIKKTSKLVQTYISPFPSIQSILFAVGFIDTEETFELPFNVAIDRISYTLFYIQNILRTTLGQASTFTSAPK